MIALEPIERISVERFPSRSLGIAWVSFMGLLFTNILVACFARTLRNRSVRLFETSAAKVFFRQCNLPKIRFVGEMELRAENGPQVPSLVVRPSAAFENIGREKF